MIGGNFISINPANPSNYDYAGKLSQSSNKAILYLWIDLGDFGYGHPMLDIAMWYFLTKISPEETAQQLFHLDREQLTRIWDLFVEDYAMAYSRKDKEAFEQSVIPFTALHMIYIGTLYGFVPGMTDYIKSVFS